MYINVEIIGDNEIIVNIKLNEKSDYFLLWYYF